MAEKRSKYQQNEGFEPNFNEILRKNGLKLYF